MPDRATMPDDRRGPDWIQLDQLAESIGEDPGQWLDGSLDPRPRIRGLSTIKAVRGWRAAERKIARIRNRDPNQAVLEALDEREAYLEEIDEDPGRREIGIFPEKEVTINGVPADEYEANRGDAIAKAKRRREEAVTDGGHDD